MKPAAIQLSWRAALACITSNTSGITHRQTAEAWRHRRVELGCNLDNRGHGGAIFFFFLIMDSGWFALNDTEFERQGDRG